jgi:conjugal transfer pilus assembly protein TraF
MRQQKHGQRGKHPMANVIFKILVIWVILLFNTNAFANESYFTEHARGWHWYNEPKESKDADEEVDSDPILQMNAVRATVQRALNKAVMQPTKANVKSYIALQNQVASNANKFNHHWQAVLLESPELNYSTLHPTNNLAKQVQYDQTHVKDEALVKGFAKHYQLYYFYRSTCPYCQRFAPILKDFALGYGFNVLAITTDGISLPEFPDSYIDQGESRIYDVTVEPTVFAVNPITHKALRIATGLTTQSEIKKNIIALLTHFEGDVS